MNPNLKSICNASQLKVLRRNLGKYVQINNQVFLLSGISGGEYHVIPKGQEPYYINIEKLNIIDTNLKLATKPCQEIIKDLFKENL